MNNSKHTRGIQSDSSDSDSEENDEVSVEESEKSNEIKKFFREEDHYCNVLNDLIQNFVKTIATDKFNILDVFGGIDIISSFHISTFLPELKASRNVKGIVTCFIKHKKLFNFNYDSFFKNQQNMHFIMCENRNIFMLDRTETKFKHYENILLTVPNRRVEEYQLFLESLRPIICKQDSVHHLDRAIALLSDITKNFEKQEKNIRFTISEIVETERIYIEKLKQIIQDVIPHIKSVIPSKTNLSSIVGIIPQIYVKQIEFRKELENCLFDFVPDDVGLCFLHNEHLFNLYLEDQEKKHNSDAIEEYKEILKTKNRTEVEFHAPLNRLIKYKLLLQKLMEDCKKAEIPLAQTEKALVMISKIISEINAVAAINSITDENIDLDAQGKLLCRNEFVVQYKISENDKTEEYSAMVFLFEKAVVFTEIKTERTNKRIVDVYLYKTHIMVKHLGIVNQSELDKSFQLYFHGRVKKYFHVLIAKDQSVRHEWTTEIKKILMIQLLAKKKSISLD